MFSRSGIVEENDSKKVPEMRDNAYGRRLVVSVELEVFGVAEEDLASSETVTDGLDYEVPDERSRESYGKAHGHRGC